MSGRRQPARRVKETSGRAVSIAELRVEIDRIDQRLLALLNRRASLAVKIGGRKVRVRQRTFAPEREQRVLARLEAMNLGPLKAEMIRSIFRQVICGCRSLEQRLRVVFLGPEGTFSHCAAREQFGSNSELAAVDSIGAVFEEVEHGRADYGVVPVENSTEGVVAATLDRFLLSDLTIKAEALFTIHLLLLSRSGRPAQVQRVVSMVQPLAQCREWLRRNFPGVAIEAVSSTAAAAAMAARDGRVAAVAGAMAREHYRLRVIAEDIQDQPRNVTRFLIVGNDGIGPRCGDDKTSLLLHVRHEAGALFRALKPFADHRVNLLALESRPLKGRPWEYVFFLDVEGHIGDRRLQRAVAAAQDDCVSLRVLGSYPAARGPE